MKEPEHIALDQTGDVRAAIKAAIIEELQLEKAVLVFAMYDDGQGRIFGLEWLSVKDAVDAMRDTADALEAEYVEANS